MTIKLTMIGMHSVLTACTGMLSGVKSEIFLFSGDACPSDCMLWNWRMECRQRHINFHEITSIEIATINVVLDNGSIPTQSPKITIWVCQMAAVQ